MRYLMTVNATKESEAGVPPTPEMMAKMGQLMTEMFQTGQLIMAGGLTPSSKWTRVAASGGRVMFTDGPFAETKEIIGGFAIMEAKTPEEARELSRRFWDIHGDGTGAIQPIAD